MRTTPSIQDLSDQLLSGITNLCTTESDLEAVGLWTKIGRERRACSPLCARVALHDVLRKDSDAAQALADRLDLRWAATVLEVRELELEELRDRVAIVLSPHCANLVPALMWSLATDPRDEVRRLAHWLMVETVFVAARHFVGHDPA